MTDEELAEYEEWFKIGIECGFSTMGSQEATRKASRLIAEVRRLKRENEDLKHKLYDERAYSSELRKQL